MKSEKRWRSLSICPTARMKKENVRWVLAVIKAKAVAVASACLNCCGLVQSLYLTILGILRILTIIPDAIKDYMKGYRACKDVRYMTRVFQRVMSKVGMELNYEVG